MIDMSYDWDEYSTFADSVLAHLDASPPCSVTDETLVRNAISRLYYHAFHCVLDWAKKHLNYTYGYSSSGTHSDLFAFVKNSELAGDKEIAIINACKKLKKAREWSDYTDEHFKLGRRLAQVKKYHKMIIESLVDMSHN